jgi:hypothetical protein
LRTIGNPARVARLIASAVSRFELDLRGIIVLTEAASEVFVVTPLIAALAGAEGVIALTRDSHHGPAEQVRSYTRHWAALLGVGDRVEVVTGRAADHADRAQLVTNLGFVRPIDAEVVARLPPDAAVALMWETWEHREQDVDLAACRRHGVPILGTRETDPRLELFRYVGMVALRLLLEAELEVFRSRVLVVASGPFAVEVEAVLSANQAEVLVLEGGRREGLGSEALRGFLAGADAVVIAEHHHRGVLIGGDGGIPVEWLRPGGTVVVHVCGAVDAAALAQAGVPVHPARPAPAGFMTVATDHVGPRPVVDLHTAGLRVGQALVEGMRRFGSAAAAEAYALARSPAMGWPTAVGA